jgi:hypothetical protein
MKNTSFTLRGQQYDSSTGKLIASPPNAPNNGVRPPASKHTSPGSMDMLPRKTRTSTTLSRSQISKPTSSLRAAQDVSAAVSIKNKLNSMRSQRISQFGSDIIANPGITKFKNALHHNIRPRVTVIDPVTVPKNESTVTKPEPVAFDQRLDNMIDKAQHFFKHTDDKNLLDDYHSTQMSLFKKSLIASSVCLFLAAATAVLSYWFIPAVHLKAASFRSGVNVQMPSFTPDGFGLRLPIDRSKGELVLDYGSDKNGQSYKISAQKATPKQNEIAALPVSGVQVKGTQIFQDKDITIYFEGVGNARWSREGNEYNMHFSDGLTVDTIARIARGL